MSAVVGHKRSIHCNAIRNLLRNRLAGVAETSYGHELSPDQRKAIIIQDRVVLATVGISNLNGEMDEVQPGTNKTKKIVFSYNLAPWMKDIQNKCPKNVTVSALTQIVEETSRNTFKDFDAAVARWVVAHTKVVPNPFVEYFVIGYESGTAIVNHVYFKIDLRNSGLKGPIFESISYAKNDFLVFGKDRVLLAKRDQKSDTYKDLLALIPTELPKALAKQDLSISEATNVCLGVLRFEAKYEGETVAPPYVIITIPPIGMGSAYSRTYAN